jgi:hypothetical protein
MIGCLQKICAVLARGCRPETQDWASMQSSRLATSPEGNSCWASYHAVGEGHEIEFARRRKLDDRPNDLLSAFVIIRREPKYKGGGGKCLIHNFYVFGPESCPRKKRTIFMRWSLSCQSTHRLDPDLHNRISGER